MSHFRLTLLASSLLLAACSTPMEKGDDRRAQERQARPQGPEDRGRHRKGDAELPEVPRRDARDRDDAGGDPPPGRPQAREGVRGRREPRAVRRPRVLRARSTVRRASTPSASPERPAPPRAPPSRLRSPSSTANRRRTSRSARPDRRDQVGDRRRGDRHADGAADLQNANASEAIVLYKRLLEKYPLYPRNDQVLYQMSRAYEELRRSDEPGDERDEPDGPGIYSGLPLPATKSSSAAASITSPARSTGMPKTPTRPSSRWGRARRITSWRSTSSAGPSTSRNSTKTACTASWRCSTTRSRPATTSKTRRTSSSRSASRTPIASSA